MLELDGVIAERGGFRFRADLAIGEEFAGVVGPSGGGKSTLIDLVAGFLKPGAGRIAWNGRDLSDLPPAKRPVSILFQDHNLFPHLTVAQNLGLVFEPSLRGADRFRPHIDTVLERLGIAELGDVRPGALSGGQRGRAGLARVLLADRPIVCLDEPFAALGPALRAELSHLTRQMLAGRTVLLVSHAPVEMRRHVQRVIFVADGRAGAAREADAFFADPPEGYRDYAGG